ncbi:MAG: tRNA preQ1(34) S-adenosylmethionine ribosyltransferase-isomerase QueA [Candidatus Zophobacter franzmannii]|nr:tRNA preQ1(34) S-adenosylmethionine ribosyltransferase-isomerase QueA [Candidatus Zophobacter franzmannii]
MSLNLRSKYHYELPEELIAQYPLPNRSQSKLLYLNRETGKREHLKFHQILELLKPGDLLVINSTKVIPARLKGIKSTGANVEVFLLQELEDKKWECLVRPGRRLKDGAEVTFSPNLKCKIVGYGEEGSRVVEFECEGDFFTALDEVGRVPLPPYILRESEEKDKETYQTVYAQENGSVAAPTAGLHFTDELLEQIRAKGVLITEVNLRVGLGTFRPVKSDNIVDHKMHSEYCEIPKESAELINKAKDDGRRVIAVGTTSTRTLESFAVDGRVKSGGHWTDIFIYPGKEVQIIDGLITNFHMPESTLLMLVSAFAGYESVMGTYREAVKLRYRFFSYGDAMVIL